MGFYIPDVIAPVPVVVDDRYTEEAIFVMAIGNVLTCMGGPNYNPGTGAIIDRASEAGAALELLRLVAEVHYGDIRMHRPSDYQSFWDLYKTAHGDLDTYLEILREIVKMDRAAGLSSHEAVPMSLRR